MTEAISREAALALAEQKVGRDHPALAVELHHAIAALPAVTVVPVYDIPVQSIEYCLLRMVVTTAQDADEKKALRLWIDTLRSKGDRG